METQIVNGLEFKLDKNEHTASAINLQDNVSKVFVPRFVEYKNEKYLVTSLKDRIFQDKSIDSLMFDEHSEIDSFDSIFQYTKINKLQIPPKLKTINGFFAIEVKGLKEIEVSPQNNNFIYYQNILLLGKSDPNNDTFDIIYYSNEDIKEVIIPPQIRIIYNFAFCFREKLKSVICTEDSHLEKLYFSCFGSSAIERLVLPSSIKNIDFGSFSHAYSIKELKIPPNPDYFFVDNKFLVDRKEKMIIFSYRNIEEVTIPSYIKKIGYGSFSRCYKLKSLSFESNASLEIIDREAFCACYSLESITIPESVIKTETSSFSDCYNLKSIKFLSRKITMSAGTLNYCSKLQAVYFPNAKVIIFFYGLSNTIHENAKIFIRRDAKINHEENDKKRFVYYENSDENEEESKIIDNDGEKESIHENHEELSTNKEKIEKLDTINESQIEMINEEEEEEEESESIFENDKMLTERLMNEEEDNTLLNDSGKVEPITEDESEMINDNDNKLADESEVNNNDNNNISNSDNKILKRSDNFDQQDQVIKKSEINDIDKELIHKYIKENDASSLMDFIHSKYNFDQISSIFNECYKIPHFFTSLCQKGIQINDAVSHHKYAISLMFNSDRTNTKNNMENARKHLEESIRLGYYMSYFSLARLLHEYFKEDDLAFKTAKEGMIKGEKYSKCLLGHFISKGIGTKKNHQEGVKLMIESEAEDYYKRFATDIGIYYYNLGENCQKDDNQIDNEIHKTSFKWFEKAFQMNKSQATINNYGVCFARGIGVSADIEKAKEIFEIGVQKNDPISMYHLGFILSKTNPTESLYYYKKSAQQGYQHAKKIITFLDENNNF